MPKYILVVGVPSDKGSETELYLLPKAEVTDSLLKELEKYEGYNWRDVYQYPCDCKKKTCYECSEWRKMKKEPDQKVSRAVWRLFNDIAIKYNTKKNLPGNIVRVFSFNQ